MNGINVFCVDCGNELEIYHDYGKSGSGWYVKQCMECYHNEENDYALDSIQEQLDGVPWDADTLDEIAMIICSTGREVCDLNNSEGRLGK